jgi:hypothetical protein
MQRDECEDMKLVDAIITDYEWSARRQVRRSIDARRSFPMDDDRQAYPKLIDTHDNGGREGESTRALGWHTRTDHCELAISRRENDRFMIHPRRSNAHSHACIVVLVYSPVR